MKPENNPTSRIEEFISRLAANNPSDGVILLDADMENSGATVIKPIINDICTNHQGSQCGRNTLNCTNLYDVCSASTNEKTCIDMKPAVSLPGCG